MFQEPVDTRKSLHQMLLIVTFIVFVQDLSSGGGAEAWTYNYSTTPNRRWLDAREWCIQHFTNMVPIRNQAENDFMNKLLPFNKNYYWIGTRKKDEEWVWEDTQETVPKDAQNWATDEPDDIASQDCVEIYIKREKDTAKWNNEGCRKKKGTICYTDSCMKDSCSANADCVETVGNYTCQCHPGFLGSRCEEAIACKPLLDTERGSHYCFEPHGSNRFNSSCRFQCDLGFQLVGVPQLECQASGQWNHPVPLCQVKQCSPTFFPATGNVTCVDTVGPFSFGSRCNFTCQEGYYLTREDTFTCLASGQWSNPTPTCAAKRCPTVSSPSHGSLVCSDPHGEFSFGSRCTSACEEGFLLNGTVDTECTSLGTWSAHVPHCLAKRCPTLSSASHGSLVCSDPHGEFSFGSRCTSACEEGFLLNGTVDTECTSLGTWSAHIPHCLAKRCPTLSSPSHGSFVCSDPHGEFSFGSRCTSACEEGFLLNGTVDTECTSLGTWSAHVPRCLAQSCPLLAKAPQHGWMNCRHPYSLFGYDSQCDFECNEGFWRRGTPTVTCNNSGSWSQDLPTCQPVQCEAIRALSLSLSMKCSHPLGNFSFSSQCLFTCEEGFSLNGTEVLFCSSSGFWNNSLPNCTEGRPVGTAMLQSAGIAAASVAASLVLIGLALLIITRFQKKGKTNTSDAPPWGYRENPAFVFET